MALLSLIAFGCGDSESSASQTEDALPTIVATMGIWADVVVNLTCGDLAQVVTLIPEGGDPHAFEPSLADRAVLDDAELVVANGLGLEGNLDRTLATVADGGTPVFRIGDAIDSISGTDPDDGHDDDHDDAPHEHQGNDPHVWFDPQRVSAALPELAEGLVDDVGLDADAVDGCTDAYIDEVAQTDADIASLVDELPADRQKLVTNHDSLAYFGDRYDFEIIGTVLPGSSTLAEASPAQLEALADTMKDVGITTIFVDREHGTDQAERVAQRVGDIEVVTLRAASLGEPGSDSDTYLGFLRTNARTITDALR